ncbi:MAG: helix-turn-helix transcriptional regulator [Proteobacteria bacterium]|nr:helix-turn-helix transcriptional regulator [Pseudomonadota bacterium]
MYIIIITMKDISEFFSQTRRLQGIKQVALAKELGITHSAIANFEAKKTKLSSETIIKIARLININPLYVTTEGVNPFKSDNLIKMVLPETLIEGLNFGIIFFLGEVNVQLNIIFLVAPSSIFQKILSKTVFENPVYAIAIKDGDNNVFLFRRKSNDPLYGERNLQLKLKEISRRYKTKINIDITKINKSLIDKIKNLTVEKEDIETFFELPTTTNNEKISQILDLCDAIKATPDDLEEALSVLLKKS